MELKLSSGIRASLDLNPGGNSPLVVFSVPNFPGKHSFFATGILDRAFSGEGMHFAKNWDDEPDVDLIPSDVKLLADWIGAVTSCADGHFEMCWVKEDPNSPF